MLESVGMLAAVYSPSSFPRCYKGRKTAKHGREAERAGSKKGHVVTGERYADVQS